MAFNITTLAAANTNLNSNKSIFQERTADIVYCVYCLLSINFKNLRTIFTPPDLEPHMDDTGAIPTVEPSNDFP